MGRDWILTDCENRADIEDLDTGDLGAAVSSAAGCRVTKRRLRGGLQDGVDLVEVDNGAMRFAVLPTRGMSLWKACKGDLTLGWTSPVRGPVHPQFVDLGEPSGLGWLDGFDELLVRCGLESNGAPEFAKNGQLLYPLHGRIANRPAHRVQVQVDDSGRITVRGIVEETRFLFAKLRLTASVSTMPGSSTIDIHDEVENLSASPAEMQMLYHINFGPPLLDKGAQLVAPVETVVPKNTRAAGDIDSWSNYAAPQQGFEEQVYLLKLRAGDDGRTAALLKNAIGTAGAALHFKTETLPCFTLWKNTTDLRDGCVTGLEPGTNFPNTRSYEGQQGRVIELAPGGKKSFDVSLTACSSEQEVEEVVKHVGQLQADREPKVFPTPQPGWCEGV